MGMTGRNAPALGLTILFILLGFFLVFYGVIIFDPFARRRDQIIVNAPKDAALSVPTVTFVDPKRGNPRGSMTLVEFGDYQCSYCKQIEPTLQEALRSYPDLTLIWKDLPNAQVHPEAQTAANAARCAGKQEKYWEYHDLLLERQDLLGKDLYPRLAEEVGIDVGRFAACMQSNEENAVVLRNVDEAIALGVDGTPYFFLGSVRLSGSISPAELAAVLREATEAR